MLDDFASISGFVQHTTRDGLFYAVGRALYFFLDFSRPTLWFGNRASNNLGYDVALQMARGTRHTMRFLSYLLYRQDDDHKHAGDTLWNKIYSVLSAARKAVHIRHTLFQPFVIFLNKAGSIASLVTFSSSCSRFIFGLRSSSTMRRTAPATVMPSSLARISSQAIWGFVKAIERRFVFMLLHLAPLVLPVKAPC